jgi:hypothetical protein
MRIEWWEHWKAILGGYFWLPCPNCGRMFGGQEGKRGEVLWNRDLPGNGLITCADLVCRAQVRARNRENGLPEGAWPLKPEAGDPLGKIKRAIMGVTLTPDQAQEVIQLVKLCVPPATMDDCEDR